MSSNSKSQSDEIKEEEKNNVNANENTEKLILSPDDDNKEEKKGEDKPSLENDTILNKIFFNKYKASTHLSTSGNIKTYVGTNTENTSEEVIIKVV